MEHGIAGDALAEWWIICVWGFIPVCICKRSNVGLRIPNALNINGCASLFLDYTMQCFPQLLRVSYFMVAHPIRKLQIKRHHNHHSSRRAQS